MRGFQHYKDQSINTMTQGELLVLLYDELVKRLIRADLALEKQEYPIFEATIDRCVDIVHYLDDTLDRQYEISRNLVRLYEFFCYDLYRVKIGRNKTELGRIKKMISELRDAFREAAKNNDSGR